MRLKWNIGLWKMSIKNVKILKLNCRDLNNFFGLASHYAISFVNSIFYFQFISNLSLCFLWNARIPRIQLVFHHLKKYPDSVAHYQRLVRTFYVRFILDLLSTENSRDVGQFWKNLNCLSFKIKLFSFNQSETAPSLKWSRIQIERKNILNKHDEELLLSTFFWRLVHSSFSQHHFRKEGIHYVSSDLTYFNFCSFASY